MGKVDGNTYYASLGEVPGDIEDDEIRNKIERIVIPEGIKVIRGFYVYNFPNLQEIDFPSSLEWIDDSAAVKVKKLSTQGLHFKNEDFALLTPSCLGLDLVEEYVKQQEEAFFSNDTTFEEACSIYNQIIIPYNYFNRSSNENALSQGLLEKFKKTNFDISFIIEKINRGKLLNAADLQCFGFYIQNLMDMPIKPIDIQKYILTICLAGMDGIVSVGYMSLVDKAKREASNISEVNAFMLFAICHEFQHIYHELNRSKDSEDLYRRLDYIDSSIQSTSDGYKVGHGYRNFHDISPDEIRADVAAYNIILALFNNPQLEKSEELIQFITEMKKKRIIKAHEIDEDNVAHVVDYRQKAFDDLLGRENLSEAERTKINELLELYVTIKKEAQAKNIDLFEDTLTWFNEQNAKSSKRITIEDIKKAIQKKAKAVDSKVEKTDGEELE